MKLDLTISLGTILNTVTIVVALVGLYYKLDKRLAILETTLGPILQWWNDQARHYRHTKGDAD